VRLLNNLIFPATSNIITIPSWLPPFSHGQSNLAAGATMGSNHNSRSNDNENSGWSWASALSLYQRQAFLRFASFTLMSRPIYPAERTSPCHILPVEQKHLLELPGSDAGLLVVVQHVRPGSQLLQIPATGQTHSQGPHVEFEAFAPAQRRRTPAGSPFYWNDGQPKPGCAARANPSTGINGTMNWPRPVVNFWRGHRRHR
jgi:hypothetical protein